MGLIEHPGFSVEGNELSGKAFVGNIWVLFLVLEDFVYVRLFVCGSEATDGVNVGLVAVAAEVVGAGLFLEFGDEGYEGFVSGRI